MSHHIDELKIHAFRQLQGLELTQLGRVNLFVGVNNSGKTTVLEAVSAFCNPLDPLEWIKLARGRFVKSSRESELDAVRWLYPQQEAGPDDDYYRGQVRIEGSGRYPNREFRARYEGIAGAPDGNGSGSSDDDFEESSGSFSPTERGADVYLTARVPVNQRLEFDADCEGEREQWFQLWEEERFISRSASQELRLPCMTVSPVAHRVEQLQIGQLSETILRRTKYNVVDLVRLIDPDVEDLEILSRQGVRPVLYVRHKRTGFTPLNVLGDGVRRIVAIALNLVAAQHGVLLIDEIETAIHKDALVRVFEWLVLACEHFDVQLFATTHSLEAVDAVLGAEDVDLAEINGYRLEAEEGRTTARRYAGELLHRLRYERALDVR